MLTQVYVAENEAPRNSLGAVKYLRRIAQQIYYQAADGPLSLMKRYLRHRPEVRKLLPWWRRQMMFSALLCVGNSPVTGEFTTQSPVSRSFGVVFDLRLNKRLSKQSRRRLWQTLWHSLWRHCNDFLTYSFSWPEFGKLLLNYIFLLSTWSW